MPTNRLAFEPIYAHCVALSTLGVPPHQILAGLAASGARFASAVDMTQEWRAVLDVALASANQQANQRGKP
jgi:hypothetical protein